MSGLHIVPLGDLIDHDTSTDHGDCVCGPVLLPYVAADGAFGWVQSHRALDDRESRPPEGDHDAGHPG